MNYKLFDDYITLQALLKNVGILHSGGAAKQFLAKETVFVNGETETRRGKKLRIGDTLLLPQQKIEINITAPTDKERQVHVEEQAEKERVAAIVKKMNQQQKSQSLVKKGVNQSNKKPIRFPGM